MSKAKPHAAQFKVKQYQVSVFWLRCACLALIATIAGYALLHTNPKLQSESVAEGSVQDLSPIESQVPVFPKDSKSEAVIAQLKAARINVDVSARPLIEAIHDLFEPLKVNYHITSGARDLIESDSMELNLKLHDVSAYSALQHIEINHSDLRITVNDGVVLVTTSEHIQSPRKMGFYDISGLIKIFNKVDRMDQKAEEAAAQDSDKNAAFTNCFGDDEDENSGCGGLPPILELFEILLGTVNEDSDHSIEAHNGMLYVRAEERDHRAIKNFIAAFVKNSESLQSLALDNKRKEDNHEAKQRGWAWKAAQSLTKTEAKIFFKDRPFTDFINFLRTKSGLNVTISNDIDIEELRVDLQLVNRSLNDALQLVLADHGLTAVPYHEALRIAPADSGEIKSYEFKLYSVMDILYPNGQVNPSLSSELLGEIIRNQTGEDNWEDPATIQTFGGQLIIFQSAEVFEKIDRILKMMRADQARHSK